jgi:hypothetical protein
VKADEVVRHVRIVCELLERYLIASSLRALRAKRTARSLRSCFGEDTSLRQSVVEHRPRNVAPFLDIVARHDHNVGGDSERVEHIPESHHLLGLARDRRLDDEKVEVAVGRRGARYREAARAGALVPRTAL